MDGGKRGALKVMWVVLVVVDGMCYGLMAVVEAVVEAWKGSSERVYEGRGRYGVWGRD